MYQSPRCPLCHRLAMFLKIKGVVFDFCAIARGHYCAQIGGGGRGILRTAAALTIDGI